MLPRTITVHKKVGETPLTALERLRTLRPELDGVPLAYAGRLDPMASGLLLVLVGEECKRQERYRGLDKEYEIQVVLGLGSDTGDVLGLVESGGVYPIPSQKEVMHVLASEVGEFERPYPAYSSKTVDGVPLFYRSLEGTLPDTLPTHRERLYSLSLVSIEQVDKQELYERVQEKLNLAPTTNEPSKALGADFRIQAVRESWMKAQQECQSPLAVLTVRVVAGSGSYMRSLASRLGAAFETKGLALSIHRTKIGRYCSPLRFWFKRY